MTIRYLDSGSDGPNACLGVWLDQELCSGIRAFRGQFGFFDIAALRKFLPVLTQMVAQGGAFHLVIGANSGDPASTDDLGVLMPLIAGGGPATLTVVGLSNALFHPKTLHLVRPNGSAAAVVGSANMTLKGLGHNVEAGLVIEGGDGADDVLNHISAAIDYWSTCNLPGVHQVTGVADVNRLLDLGLVVPPATRRRLRNANRARGSASGRGARPIGWRPQITTAVAEEPPPEVEAAGDSDAAATVDVPTTRAAIAVRWCKRLPSSDAQQVRPGTNPTGKLRLAQAGFEIDQTTYFREVLFGEEDWVRVDRHGKAYEEAHIRFSVTRPGDEALPMTLRVDHAAHRVASQRNVPTILGWGTELGQWLRQNNQTGNWVLLEKDLNGNYWLSFRASKPDWAP